MTQSSITRHCIRTFINNFFWTSHVLSVWVVTVTHFTFLLAAGDKTMRQKGTGNITQGLLKEIFFHRKTVQTCRFCPGVREPVGRRGKEKGEQRNQNQGKLDQSYPMLMPFMSIMDLFLLHIICLSMRLRRQDKYLLPWKDLFSFQNITLWNSGT